jgi:hypothetical protein
MLSAWSVGPDGDQPINSAIDVGALEMSGGGLVEISVIPSPQD